MWWLWAPLLILGVVVVLFLLVVVLGRYRQGALLRPIIVRLSRIGFLRRFFQRVSTAALERQNPELASAIRKINTVAANPNPQAMQKAMSKLSAAERRAYLEAAGEQGEGVPENANRQMRRQAERMQQQARGGRPGGGSSASRKRKRR